MNCQVVQRRLLSIANPEQVPVEVCAHLAGCAACREWHNELVLLERHIPLLPIPSSNGKTRLMRRLLQDQTVSEHVALTISQAPCLPPPPALPHTPVLLQPRTLLLGMAAALLVIVLSWLGIQSWLETTAVQPSKPRANALLEAPPRYSGVRNFIKSA